MILVDSAATSTIYKDCPKARVIRSNIVTPYALALPLKRLVQISC